MTIENRKTGWLEETQHLAFRELLLHTCGRYDLICPVYCLMPDHIHFLLGGLTDQCDQQPAIKFFRREWNKRLRVHSVQIQKQAYDHVLTEAERSRDAFQSVCHYLLENPVRAEFVTHSTDWPYLGTIVPGYPDIHPQSYPDNLPGFLDHFWKLHGFAEKKAVHPKP